MTEPTALERFLNTDPADVGCAEAIEVLHVYTELTATAADAEAAYPGVAAHLRACEPCFTDYEGLLAAIADPAH